MQHVHRLIFKLIFLFLISTAYMAAKCSLTDIELGGVLGQLSQILVAPAWGLFITKS